MIPFHDEILKEESKSRTRKTTVEMKKTRRAFMRHSEHGSSSILLCRSVSTVRLVR